MSKTIDRDVLQVLTGAEVDGNVVRIHQQLSRPLYEKVDKVLRELGGRWDKSKSVRGHVFNVDPGEVIDQACLTGSYEKHTVGGWFPTPPEIARDLVKLLDADSSMTVLEPSAGLGALAFAVGDVVGLDNVTCLEISHRRATNLSNAGCRVRCCDFLEVPPNEKFHRVLMNPPFERLADIRHVLHAYEFLDHGGRLVSIMGSGWTFRQDRIAQQFQEWTETVPARVKWEELPAGSFKASGTMVSTGILIVDKAAA